jgi:hypothetical protein
MLAARLEERATMSPHAKLLWVLAFACLATLGAVHALRALNVTVMVHVFVPAVSDTREIERALPAPYVRPSKIHFTPSAQHPEKKKTIVRLLEPAPSPRRGVNLSRSNV